MYIMNTFFISLFITLTSLTPPDSWVQFTKPFKTIAQCEQYIERNAEGLIYTFMQQANLDVNATISQLACLTYDEAVRRNKELGHN